MILVRYLLLVTFICITACLFDKKDDFEIVAGKKVGPVTRQTSMTDLVRLLGAENVKKTEISEEGYSEPAVSLFPKTPAKAVTITWHNPQKEIYPHGFVIRGGSNAKGEMTSAWKVAKKITIGTSLKELERLNAEPFRIAGFDWDYAGTVLSWGKGRLAKTMSDENGRILLRLNYDLKQKNIEGLVNQVSGDGEFSSGHPAMQKLNPKVYEISIEFRKPKSDNKK